MTNSIKFFWNGIKVNGDSKLIKCYFFTDDENIIISVRDGSGSLPRDIFEVENDTDYYADYYDDDRARLTPEHPLYKYARHAHVKALIRDLNRGINYYNKKLSDPGCIDSDFYRTEIEKRVDRLIEMKDVENPGQPTASEVKAARLILEKKEQDRLAAEDEQRKKEREKVLDERSKGGEYIEKISSEYPVNDGDPVVTIEWSENPAFYNWADGELKLSVAAAEIILSHFDSKVFADLDSGYDKTKFTIAYTKENGDPGTYEGRYDLGDNDGGMIEHIRSFGRHMVEKGRYGHGDVSEEDRSFGNSILAFADMLDEYIASSNIIHVKVASWLEYAARLSKEKEDANNN